MEEDGARTKHQMELVKLREKALEQRVQTELQWLRVQQQAKEGKPEEIKHLRQKEQLIRIQQAAEKAEIERVKANYRAERLKQRLLVHESKSAIIKFNKDTRNLRSKIERGESD